jgi:hypothetical protein
MQGMKIAWVLAALCACRVGANGHRAVYGAEHPVWIYLVGKYDEDADGRISAAEYDRPDLAFARLDRDRDGILTALDFEQQGPPGSEEELSRARRALATYFQNDADTSRFAMVELDDAMSIYDTNADGRLVHAEFTSIAASRRQELPTGTTPTLEEAWEILLAMMDGDRDGALDRGEAYLFFYADGDGSLVVDLQGNGVKPRVRPVSSKPTGPAPGTTAPDFALGTADDEGTYSLSKMYASGPVALVFGSYT